MWISAWKVTLRSKLHKWNFCLIDPSTNWSRSLQPAEHWCLKQSESKRCFELWNLNVYFTSLFQHVIFFLFEHLFCYQNGAFWATLNPFWKKEKYKRRWPHTYMHQKPSPIPHHPRNKQYCYMHLSLFWDHFFCSNTCLFAPGPIPCHFYLLCFFLF